MKAIGQAGVMVADDQATLRAIAEADWQGHVTRGWIEVASQAE